MPGASSRIIQRPDNLVVAMAATQQSYLWHLLSQKSRYVKITAQDKRAHILPIAKQNIALERLVPRRSLRNSTSPLPKMRTDGNLEPLLTGSGPARVMAVTNALLTGQSRGPSR
jgi:hypothetical protein